MDAGIIFNAWPICNILVWLLRGGEQLNVLDDHPAILVEACAQGKHVRYYGGLCQLRPIIDASIYDCLG